MTIHTQYTNSFNDIAAFYANDETRNNRSNLLPLTNVQTATAAYVGTMQALKDAGVYKGK